MVLVSVWGVLLALPASVIGTACPNCPPSHVSNTLVAEAGFESYGPTDFHDAASIRGDVDVHGSANLWGDVVIEGDLTVTGTVRGSTGEDLVSGSGSGANPASCEDILDANPSSPSGEYDITVRGMQVRVKCDMATRGGGWTAAARIKKGAGMLPMQGTLSMWRDLNLQEGDPTAPGEPQYHLPLSHFADPAEGVFGEGLEVLVTSKDDLAEKPVLVGFNNKCLFDTDWQFMASMGLGTGWTQKCVPAARSAIPMVAITDAGDVEVCNAEILGTTATRRFFHVGCSPQTLVTFTAFGNSGLTNIMNGMSVTFGSGSPTEVVFHVRRHRRSRYTSLVAGFPVPSLLHRFPLGPGAVDDTVGTGFPTLTETGALARVVDACGAANGAIEIDGNSEYLGAGDVSGIHYTGSWAVSFWLRYVSGCCGRATIISYRHNSVGSNGWEVHVANDGNLRMHAHFSGTDYETGSGVMVPPNKWVHVEAGYVRDSTNGKIVIRLLGSSGNILSEESAPISDFPTVFQASGNKFSVGYHPNPFNARSMSSLKFEIDDIRFTSEPRTAKTILKGHVETPEGGTSAEACPA